MRTMRTMCIDVSGRLWLGALIFSVSLGAPATAAVDKKPVVFVKKVKISEMSENLTYPARIEPRIRASVIAEADGVVTKIVAPLGSSVRAKSPLLIIRNTDPVYNYAAMTVTSTVPGVVSKVEVTEGSRVSRGDKLVMVTDPEQVRVAVEITALDVSSIKPGMSAEMRIPGSDDAIPLKVKGLSPFVDPVTGTASCELELAKVKGKSKRLPPLGLIGRVYFRVNLRKGISIPDSALTYRGKDPFVRVVEGDKAKLVAVTLGRKEAGSVEVLKGLKDGDQLIERSSGFVSDGEKVEIQATDTEKASQG